jgi:predicted nucleic acid-binding protein
VREQGHLAQQHWALGGQTTTHPSCSIAARRQRITQADVQIFTVALSRLRLRVSRLDTLTVIRDGTASAIKLGLTAHDGAYVDLALQAGVALATLDMRMRVAAAAAGATVFGS